MDALKHFATPCLKENPPAFSIGDTVRVGVRIKEGEKSRVQAFEGTVIAKKHGGIQETFTVRRMSHGVGVERVFPRIRRWLSRLLSSARARCAAASFTISETVSARPPASRKPANNFQMALRERDKQLSLFAVFHRERNRRQEGLSWRITERTGRKARRPRNPQKGISPLSSCMNGLKVRCWLSFL